MNKHARLLGLLLAFAVPFCYTTPASAATRICAYAEREALTDAGTVTYFFWNSYWLTYCQ